VDINALAYHKLDVYTGSDDKTAARVDLDSNIIRLPRAPPAF
jgi:hypothetical protein